MLAAGCRVFEAGLPVMYDGGPTRVRPPLDAGHDADAARTADDAARESPRDEASVPGPLAQMGCADGTREGFTSVADWPDIAGCSGAWLVAGLLDPDARVARCQRQGGNDGRVPGGEGCSVVASHNFHSLTHPGSGRSKYAVLRPRWSAQSQQPLAMVWPSEV